MHEINKSNNCDNNVAQSLDIEKIKCEGEEYMFEQDPNCDRCSPYGQIVANACHNLDLNTNEHTRPQEKIL